MLASTIRDFKLILRTFSEGRFEPNQYLKKNKPNKWSNKKTEIFLKVLKEFGLIELSNSIYLTEQGKKLILFSANYDFIENFFNFLNNFKQISDVLTELNHYFILNPNIPIKKLAKKTKKTRDLGIIGQYFISIIVSSFFLHNKLPREEKYLELIVKSFLNTFIDKEGISCRNLFQYASDYNVNKNLIKIELLKKWQKNFQINFPNEINKILIHVLKLKSVISIPFYVDIETLDENLIEQSVKKFPLIIQYAKVSKSTNEMKIKLTEEIFLDELIITLK